MSLVSRHGSLSMSNQAGTAAASPLRLEAWRRCTVQRESGSPDRDMLEDDKRKQPVPCLGLGQGS